MPKLLLPRPLFAGSSRICLHAFPQASSLDFVRGQPTQGLRQIGMGAKVPFASTLLYCFAPTVASVSQSVFGDCWYVRLLCWDPIRSIGEFISRSQTENTSREARLRGGSGISDDRRGAGLRSCELCQASICSRRCADCPFLDSQVAAYSVTVAGFRGKVHCWFSRDSVTTGHIFYFSRRLQQTEAGTHSRNSTQRQEGNFCYFSWKPEGHHPRSPAPHQRDFARGRSRC